MGRRECPSDISTVRDRRHGRRATLEERLPGPQSLQARRSAAISQSSGLSPNPSVEVIKCWCAAHTRQITSVHDVFRQGKSNGKLEELRESHFLNASLVAAPISSPTSHARAEHDLIHLGAAASLAGTDPLARCSGHCASVRSDAPSRGRECTQGSE